MGKGAAKMDRKKTFCHEGLWVEVAFRKEGKSLEEVLIEFLMGTKGGGR